MLQVRNWVVESVQMVGQRNWKLQPRCPTERGKAIRKKIVKLRGPGLEVPEVGHWQNGETIADYLERNPKAAGAMSLSISENCSRQRCC